MRARSSWWCVWCWLALAVLICAIELSVINKSQGCVLGGGSLVRHYLETKFSPVTLGPLKHVVIINPTPPIEVPHTCNSHCNLSCGYIDYWRHEYCAWANNSKLDFIWARIWKLEIWRQFIDRTSVVHSNECMACWCLATVFQSYNESKRMVLAGNWANCTHGSREPTAWNIDSLYVNISSQLPSRGVFKMAQLSLASIPKPISGFLEIISESGDGDCCKGGNSDSNRVKNLLNLNEKEWQKLIGGAVFVFGILVYLAYFVMRRDDPNK